MGRPNAPKVDHPYVFSVSQLETFSLCNRKWAFEKIDKLEGKENEFAALGQRVHDVLEKYLDKAIPIDRSTKEGKIAFPGIKHLPLPRTKGMRVEKWFVIKFGVAAYRGLKDVEIIVPGREPIILDHKSTRNFRWKKTKKQLLVNLQAGIYAADAMLKSGSATVILKWVYYATEGKPKSEPVEVRISKAQVEAILSEADEIAQQMVKTLQTKRRALDVYPNFSSCEAFGGCGYKEHCVRTPTSVLRSIMAQKKEERMATESTTSKFLADLKNRNAAKKTPEEKKAAPSVKLKDAQTVKVNPPEREETEQPRPPAPKKIGGKWVNAEWDEAAWSWVFPGEEEAEKEEKAAAASKKVEDKKAGKVSTTSTKVKTKPAVQEIEDVEEEEEETAEEAAEEPEEKPAKVATKPAASKPATKPAPKEEEEEELAIAGLTVAEAKELVGLMLRVKQLLERAEIPF